MQSVDNWKKAKQATRQAAEWNELPNGQRYQSDNFAISPSHCKILLMRCGQKSHGGMNYWESPDSLNRALIEVIVRRQKELIGEAIALLRLQEAKALAACETELRDMLRSIEDARVEDDVVNQLT